jgi:hypothetical protein
MKTPSYIPGGLAVAPLFFGCAASEESVQADFGAFVGERNSCEEDAECMIGSYGCPLGCGTAINRKYEDEVAEEAARLIKKYERGGRSCAYGCLAEGEPLCDAGTCVIGEAKTEECTSVSSSFLDFRVPQVVTQGECPLDAQIVSELDFESPVATFDCTAEGDSCLCLLASLEAPLDEPHWILVSEGERYLGMVSPFFHERACSYPNYGAFLATLEDLEDMVFLSHEVSTLKQAAFATANRSGCSDDAHCLAIPIGAKACGGPSAYVVYFWESTDQESLFELAQAATDAELAFNSENNISSNCGYWYAPTLACQDSTCVRVEVE